MLAALCGGIGGGLALVDGDGYVRLWKDRAARVPSDQAVGRHWTEVLPGLAGDDVAFAIVGGTALTVVKSDLLAEIRPTEINGRAASLILLRDADDTGKREAILDKRARDAEELVEEARAALKGTPESMAVLLRAQARAQKRERHLDHALTAIGEGVWDWDIQTGTINHNEQWSFLFGLGDGRRDHAFSDLIALVHDADRDRVVGSLAGGLEGSGRYDCEYRVLRPDGHVIWVQDRGTVIERNAKGKPVRMVGALRDVSDHNRALARLDEILDLNNKIVALSTQGILSYQASGRCILANEAAASIFGSESFALQSRNFLEDEFWLASGLTDAALWCLETGRPGKVEVRGVTATNKDVWLDCDVVPFVSGTEPYFVLILTDIGDIRRAVDQAAKASQAKTQFIANMSHEIRTPMNAILGLVYLLDHSQLTDEQRGLVRNVHSASRSLLSIIDDVLDFSKIESGQMEIDETDFRLADVLNGVRAILTAAANAKKLHLVTDVAQDVPAVLRGDPLRLHQILVNLGGNAIKFTEQGRVTITITVAGRQPGGVVLKFAVSDTGIGISPEALPRLFNAFVQADASTTRIFGGSGLGLVICKRLTELMGGRIDVESTLGRGSQFEFTIPCGIAGEQALAGRGSGGDEGDEWMRLTDLRILVVDDNFINREVAQRVLQRDGALVTLAEGGQDSVDIVAGSADAFDMIVMDLQMPGMDGYEATRRIRGTRLGRHVPIIAFTAGVMKGEREKALAAGMVDFIIKPADTDKMIATICHHTGRSALAAACRAPYPMAANSSFTPIAGIDCRKAYLRLDGDHALFTKLLRRLVEQTDLVAAALSDNLSVTDPDQAARLLHGLRGAAGNVAATRLAELAAALEGAIRGGTSGDAPPVLAAFLRHTEEISVVIQKALNVEESGQAAIPAAQLDLDQVKMLVIALDDHDFAAVDLFDSIRSALVSAYGESACNRIAAVMDQLRFADARSALMALLENGHGQQS
jgi:PAS domain S-box-containing protein